MYSHNVLINNMQTTFDFLNIGIKSLTINSRIMLLQI